MSGLSDIRIFTHDPAKAVDVAQAYIDLVNVVAHEMGAPEGVEMVLGALHTQCDHEGCEAVTEHGGTEGWTHVGVEDFCPEHSVVDAADLRAAIAAGIRGIMIPTLSEDGYGANSAAAWMREQAALLAEGK